MNLPGAEGDSTTAEDRPEVIIITGMSGAGRTQVAKILEDLGTYVVDNLPPTLVDKVVDLAFGPGSSVDRLGLVADVRGREFFGQLVQSIETLRASRASVRIVFLEASDETLVHRYEEHRRRHPADEGSGLLDAIEHERELLSEVRGMADLVIDTTDLNVHELRDRVVDALGEDEAANLQVQVVSFGFKHGTPRDADLVMDVRFLPNPHWVEELRPHDGRDDQVREYVLGQASTQPFLEKFKALLDTVLPGYVAEGKRYLTIAIGCTGGRHRSVAIAEEIGRHLEARADVPVFVEHRDLDDQ
ncbi:MAG: RNase adapter RapZ [Nitriliruptorales bacterium]|nr:RNase adapter RapZ [Nitriliruptorales bacterium]